MKNCIAHLIRCPLLTALIRTDKVERSARLLPTRITPIFSHIQNLIQSLLDDRRRALLLSAGLRRPLAWAPGGGSFQDSA